MINVNLNKYVNFTIANVIPDSNYWFIKLSLHCLSIDIKDKQSIADTKFYTTDSFLVAVRW